MEVQNNRKFDEEEDEVMIKVEIESGDEDDHPGVQMNIVAARTSTEMRVPETQPLHIGPFTNFSIDEILKPSFGKKCKTSQQIHRHFNPRNINIRMPSSCTPIKTSPVLKTSQVFVSKVSPMMKTSPVFAAQTSPLYKDENTSPVSSPGSSPASEGRSTSGLPLPAWVYCTRYSDRPSSGPRSRKIKKREKLSPDDKRPRTAFSNEQLQRLKREFESCQYLTEQRRQDLSRELQLSEGQIKIWFQNKRAKVKKSAGSKNLLALHLMAQGLYNHATAQIDSEC